MKQIIYEPLRAKYGLPSFNELDSEFDISLIEEENFVLRNVCKKICERLDCTIDIVERILQPDPNSFVDIYECKFFRGAEKDELFRIFKQLMHSQRTIVELDLLRNDNLLADFIKRFYAEWLQLRKSLHPFIAKLKDSWKEEKQGKERLEYLG